MSIQVVSSTDNQETKFAQESKTSQESVKEDTQSASAQEQDETTEESETSEQEVESKAHENEPDDSETEDSDDEQRSKRSKGVERKIKKLTSRISAKDQEIEFWKAKALEQESQRKSQQTETSKVETKADGEPNPDDFETHAEYVKALAKYTLKAEREAEQTKQREAVTKSEQDKIEEAHRNRLKEFVKTQEDYQEVMEDFMEEHPRFSISPILDEAIMTSDLGPAIIYELMKNPTEFERINKLGFVAAAREIGKLEAKLSPSETSKEEKIKKLTSAPPPLKTIGSKSGPVKKSLSDPNLSQREYEQMRAEQMAKRAQSSF